VISKGILKELRKLAESKKKNARDARTALLLIAQKGLTIDKDEGMADKWILRHAAATSCLVCTNDTALRGRLRAIGVTAFSLGIGGQLR